MLISQKIRLWYYLSKQKPTASINNWKIVTHFEVILIPVIKYYIFIPGVYLEVNLLKHYQQLKQKSTKDENFPFSHVNIQNIYPEQK